jgi:primosomal protein N'
MSTNLPSTIEPMTKHIVPPPKRTCRYCGQGGQILFRKCPKCGRRYLGSKPFGAVH